MSAIQLGWIEGCLQFRVWIRGVSANRGRARVSAIQEFGLEACLQFSGLDLRG